LSQLSIILDTDFLSAFLKVNRLSLIRDFYQVDCLLVPPAVYREISATSLIQDLANLSWVQVEAPAPGWELPRMTDLFRLGAGEQQAIALARQSEQAFLLSNDNSARRFALRLGVKAIDIPEFLLSCKAAGFLGREELQALVLDLQVKDRYGFRREILERLLS
jgi:predicted nucleic acid-binding protein